MNVPFPKGFVMEAWKARVGASLLRWRSHAAVTRVGTRSHLFSRKIRCLWLASFLMKASACGARVPSGSRASRTSTTTSLESMTCQRDGAIAGKANRRA